MNEGLLAVSLVWLFVFIYAILGSIDFGAGFWGMVHRNEVQGEAGALANRFLSPTWEVTNVFLVLLVVTLVSFFPAAIYTVGMALLLPGSLVLILLTIRSAMMAFQHSVRRFKGALEVVSGVTGVLIPSLLVSVLPILTGGFIDPESGMLRVGKLFTSPVTYAYLAFGLSSQLFLSASFLADYAREADNEPSYRVFRRHAVRLGPLTLITAVLTTWTIGQEASWLRQQLLEEGRWFLLSILAFLIGYLALFWKRRDRQKYRGWPRVAFILFIIQYALASFAYGRAHLPYLVYPSLTVDNSVTNPEMFRLLMVSYGIGLAILIPGFYLFWRLFLKDKRYLAPKEEGE